jgi:hypothetical protein
VPARRLRSACAAGLGWYVPRALGEETATSVRPPRRLPGERARAVWLAVAAALLSGLSACGDDAPRQDAGEPEAEFPVEVVSAKFPAEQRLAEATELALELENPGSEAVPNLVVTVQTGSGDAAGPFSVRSEQPGLSGPSRPAWILENGFPKAVRPGEQDLDALPGGGSGAGRTTTFAFGALEPGEYTVAYEVAAGLGGKATAVSEGGDPVDGEFEVTISDEVPRIEVDGSGNVVIENG